MSYIDVRHEFKRYQTGDHEIVANNDVSFSIEKGELVVILGAPGTGKPTPLNILGVVPPDNVMFNPELAPIEFVVPAVVIGAVTLALHFVELVCLRRVDMLEALKSVG